MKSKNLKRVNLAPGAVIFTGDRKVEHIDIHYTEFNSDHFYSNIFDNRKIKELSVQKDNLVQWYDVRGLHDTQLIEALGKLFKVHPLALEDIANIYERPKSDIYPEGIFLTLKSIELPGDQVEVKIQQVAFYLAKGCLLSFQEASDDLFYKVRERLAQKKGRVRDRGVDYLLYVLLDSIIDQYFVTLDKIEQQISSLEADIIQQKINNSKQRIYLLRHELYRIRKVSYPLKELINNLQNIGDGFMSEGTRIFLRDLQDHIGQIIDITENCRDDLNNLQDLYLAELSQQTNHIVQILTIVSTVFIPLTFLAGIYGMNFKHMPELEWQYGYYYLWAIMIFITIIMLWYFKRKRWL